MMGPKSGIRTNVYGLMEYRFTKLAEQLFSQEDTRLWSQALHANPNGGDLTTQAVLEIATRIFDALGPISKMETASNAENGVLADLGPGTGPCKAVVSRMMGTRVTELELSGCELMTNTLRDSVLDAFLATGHFVTTKEQEDNIEVRYIFPTQHGLEVVHRQFAKEPLRSIEQNYDPDIVAQVRDVLVRMQQASNGIVILNGPPGTGKTHLVRAILSECASTRTPAVCNPPLEFLTKVGLLATAVTQFNASVVVLEDLGDILTTQAARDHVQVYANILNVTDGLLPLLSNSVLC